MGTRYLYLVRHGQYRMDREKADYGTLTVLGRRQAQRVGKLLAAQFPIQVLHHSDMVRAVETADIISRHLSQVPLRQSRLLREGIPTAPSHWSGDWRPTRARMNATKARMDSAFGRFFKATRGKDRHELIVAHGNLIRYLVRRAMDDTAHRWWRMQILQCSLCVVAVAPAPRGGLLIRFNDVGHLPPKMQTHL